MSGHIGKSAKAWHFEVNQSDFNKISIYTAARGVLVYKTGLAPQKGFAFIPLQLTDPNVAGGQANTNALLEVEAFNAGQNGGDELAELLAVFYPTSGNTAPNLTIDANTGDITGSYTNVGSSNNGVFTPAPEPSGLGLLALGAAGILARRQRKKEPGAK